MSNEKLGVEQGRGEGQLRQWCTGTTPPPEECYVAWCRYKDNRILLCDSDAPRAFKVYRWAMLTEQAYHARGAGRETDEAMKARLHAVIYDPHGGAISSHWTVDRVVENVMTLLRREPGADTGTTPSRDCVWIVEQNGAVHSVHSTYESAYKEEGENLRIGVPWQVLPWREAERGTTPPEGLEFETIDGEQQSHGMVVRNLTMLVRRLIHRIRSKYKAPDDVVAKQAWDYLMGEGLQGSVLRDAATQRAPVERDKCE